MSDFVAIIHIEDPDEALSPVQIEEALQILRTLDVFAGVPLNIEVRTVETT